MAQCNQCDFGVDSAAVKPLELPSWVPTLERIWRSLADFVYARQRRRKLRQLHQLDDAMLEDIGVTRSELHLADTMPLSVNAAVELQTLSLKRRRRENTGELPR